MPKRRSPSPSAQLELFGPAVAPSTPSSPAQPRSAAPEPSDDAEPGARLERLRKLAARLPATIRFGTSSWSFPGWAGIVYPPGWDEARLAREGLPLYARHPLLRTVGIDRSYYAPLGEAQLRKYASQLPEGFPCCAKVPESFTCPVFLGRGRGERGEVNPDFLHAERFRDVVLKPFEAAFRDHLGALLLEFPPVPSAYRLPPETFLDRLDKFLYEVARDAPLAVELRDRRLLSADYASVLRLHRVSHVYNYWTAMPGIAEQLETVPIGASSIAVARLMLRPGTRYEARKREFQPFDRIVDPNPGMRAEVVDLAKIATALGRVLFVLVNNKAEGSAPLTIEALAEACAAPPGNVVGIVTAGHLDTTNEEPR